MWARTRPFHIAFRDDTEVSRYTKKQERRIYWTAKLLEVADRWKAFWHTRRTERGTLLREEVGSSARNIYLPLIDKMILFGRRFSRVIIKNVRRGLPEDLQAQLDVAETQYIVIPLKIPLYGKDGLERDPDHVASKFNTHAALYNGHVDFNEIEIEREMDEDLARIVFERLGYPFPEDGVKTFHRINVFTPKWRPSGKPNV